MAKLSIIVPVYNTGKYLNKCVESILSQSYSDFELILVDDGSDVETAEICDDLAGRDKRIQVYHKNNEGVSVARNFGIDKAKGEYLGFVDSDDWIEKGMYEALIHTIETTHADVVYCDATTIWDNGKTELDTFTTLPTSCLLNIDKLSPSTTCQMAGSAWRGLFKTSTREGIRFPEGLKFSEDRIYNLKHLSQASTVYYLKESFYFRYMREGSCVNSYHPDAIQTVLRSSIILQEIAFSRWGQPGKDIYVKQMAYSLIAFASAVVTRSKNDTPRYKEFCQIASTPELHQAIEQQNLSDFRSWLIKHKQYALLYIITYLYSQYRRFHGA